MTPHHDHLLSAGWTTEDNRLYRRGAVVLVACGGARDWWASVQHTCPTATAGASGPTPNAALAVLRQRLHDAIAGAQRALEDLP
jgi:hypothetical protein